MPKLPPDDREPLCWLRLPNVLKVLFVEADGDWPEFSKSWFAGDDMIESDVIKDEITSGEAGCTWTRLEDADGP